MRSKVSAKVTVVKSSDYLQSAGSRWEILYTRWVSRYTTIGHSRASRSGWRPVAWTFARATPKVVWLIIAPTSTP